MIKTSIIAATMLAALSLISATASAMPVTYNFEQGGFSEGALVTGWFSGKDTDNDGQLSTLNGEIDDFYVSFSGNSLVSKFELFLTDLVYLAYDLEGGYLGNTFSFAPAFNEGIEASNGLIEYLAGPDIFFTECGLGYDCSYVAGPTFADIDYSSALVKVPEPASAALLLSGLLGAGLMRRRQAQNIA